MTAEQTARAIAAGWNAEPIPCEGSGQRLVFAARYTHCPVCQLHRPVDAFDTDAPTIDTHYPPATPAPSFGL